MKTYFTFIKYLQEILLGVSIIILATLPTTLVLSPDSFSENSYIWLYAIAHFSLFLVMMIRPLADIWRQAKWLRPLVILRKGMGVLSASIIVSFILSKVMLDAGGYFGDFLTADYWSLANLALLAHLADISAVLLLITSNNLSKRLLGKGWKHIQRLSYVYFYASGLYVLIILEDKKMLYYLIPVTIVTVLAWHLNRRRTLLTNPN